MKYPKATYELTHTREYIQKWRERETHEEGKIKRGGEEDYSSEKDTAGRINKETRKSFLVFFFIRHDREEIFLLIKIFVYVLLRL